jgi:hypothetical protein
MLATGKDMSKINPTTNFRMIELLKERIFLGWTLPTIWHCGYTPDTQGGLFDTTQTAPNYGLPT